MCDFKNDAKLEGCLRQALQTHGELSMLLLGGQIDVAEALLSVATVLVVEARRPERKHLTWITSPDGHAPVLASEHGSSVSIVPGRSPIVVEGYCLAVVRPIFQLIAVATPLQERPNPKHLTQLLGLHGLLLWELEVGWSYGVKKA